jgi:hypothetical protein
MLDQAVCRPDVAREMAGLFQTQILGSLATSLRYSLRGDSLDVYLGQLARNAVQPAVRALATKCLIEGVATWHEGWKWQWVDKPLGRQRVVPIAHHRPLALEMDLRSAIQSGLTDRSNVVRRAALQGLIGRIADVENPSHLAASFLDDKSPSIRERALFVMRHATAGRDAL